MSAYQLVSLGFIAGFGIGGLTMLGFCRHEKPEDFGRPPKDRPPPRPAPKPHRDPSVPWSIP
jgi:hypothetical protein